MLSPRFRESRTYRRGAVCALALCIASLVLANCGQSVTVRGVSLLPVVAAKNQTWAWTPACQLIQYTPTGSARLSPDLGVAQLEGDEWNLGGGATAPGSVDMSVDSLRGVTIKGDFPSTPPCTASTCIAPSAGTWVRGYPSVLYGINQCHASSSPPESRSLRLPMRVGSIPSDLIATTSYASNVSNATYDIAYDMWLNDSGTKTPCSTDGTVEIMVWTDYDQQAVLPDTQVEAASVPFSVNGTAEADTNAWSVYVDNIFRAGQTEPWGGTIWFVLNRPNTVSDGTVSVDLSSVFSAAGTLLHNDYGWSDFQRNYWLDTVPFGIEYGPEDAAAASTAPTQFSLKLSSFCLEVGTSVSDAGCNLLTNH